MLDKCECCNRVANVDHGNPRYNWETKRWEYGRLLCRECGDAEELGQRLLNCGRFAKVILEGLRSGEIWMVGGSEGVRKGGQE